MKRQTRFVKMLYSLFCFFLLAAYAHAETFLTIRDERGQSVCYYEVSHALLIGVSDYTNGWPALPSVPAEMEAIETFLTQQGFYVTKYLNLTAGELELAFEQFIDYNGFDRDARLLFVFAGHGYTRGNRGYLVPADAPDPRLDEKGFLRRALSMDQILAWARQIEAKHALFLFDSCFSGSIFQTRALPEFPPPIDQTIALPVRQFITGGGVNDELPSTSVFTPAFVDALRYGWGDLDGDGYITGSELGLYLHNKVPMYADQTPQFARIKDYDLARGEFVFVAGNNQQTAMLTVLSNVEDDTVYIDGQIQGSTRVDRELPLGVHTIRVTKDGYFPFDSSVNLQQSQTLHVTLEPQVVVPRQQWTSTSSASRGDWTDPLTGMEFVWIPSGCFLMGCTSDSSICDSDEKPVHSVCVSDFWMGKYEVTQAQWQAVMGQNPSYFVNHPHHPAENVSYEEVQQFILTLNRNESTDAYRLPSEAEWEYAARAGSNSLYSFGNDSGRLGQYGWYVRNSENRSQPVGQLQPNAYSLYDVYGNVWEWCLDRYDARYYATSATDDPRGPFSGADRIARGGSWAYEAQYCRSGYRFHHPPYFRSADLGFRLVRTPD